MILLTTFIRKGHKVIHHGPYHTFHLRRRLLNVLTLPKPQSSPSPPFHESRSSKPLPKTSFQEASWPPWAGLVAGIS